MCPRFNRKTEGGRTFSVSTCQFWNSLSLEIRKQHTISSFKTALKNSFFIRSVVTVSF